MSVGNGWTGAQYSVYRVIFATYLVVHFVHLVPWGAELFSNAGMLPDAAASPLHPLFPSVLFVWDDPLAVSLLLGLGVLAGVAFGLGLRDRGAALIVWYVWACLYTRNPLISNPGLPFVGWLLLAHVGLPPRPFGSWDARGRRDPGGGWRMPESIHGAAWIVMSLGYTYSGATKLVSPSWLDGSALARVLSNPLARPTFLREVLLDLPAWLLQGATWTALGAELLFAPLALLPRLRPLLWGVLLGMHLGLMLLVDFADLSAGMVLLHLFTFRPSWVPALRARGWLRSR